jgi:tetratricopeptide (TPR) repeat protein
MRKRAERLYLSAAMKTLLLLIVPALPALAGSAIDEAFTLARTARDTADGTHYARAEQLIAPLLRSDPQHFEALKVRAWVLLGQHRFREALELARALNKRVPDDLQVHGFIADACMELGLYEEAEKAAQWMLDLRPGNVAGLTRAAYLREVWGDVDGALDFMKKAFQRTRPEETGDRAWLLTHIAHLLIEKREYSNAERALKEALRIFPNYHYALANLAKIYTARGDHAEAANLYRRRYEAAPHPENLFDLGAALSASGDLAGARRAFADFEKAARAEMNGPDNANRELATYYLDYARNFSEALRIMKREVEVRRDVQTMKLYERALARVQPARAATRLP